jgi:hypothetical protein
MIEGLHFDITATEMKEHLEEREEYHFGRATWYKGEADRLRKGNPDFDQQVSGANPLQQLENKRDEHFQRADLLRFMRLHVVEDTYRLSQADLIELEFITGRRRWV